MKALRHIHRLVPALLVIGFGMPAAAQEAQSTASMGERIDLSGRPTIGNKNGATLRLSQSQGEPIAAGGTSVQDSLNGTLPTARRSMLWAVHERSGVGVGFGVEQRESLRAGAINQPQRSGAMLMGVSVDTSERSQVFVQTPVLNERADNGGYRLNELPPSFDPQQRQVRLGLVFNSTNQIASLRKGLRMELSGQSSLTLKPRGGKIGVAFQKTW